MHLQRTTLSLPEPLLARLQAASRQARISMSALAADLLDHALASRLPVGLGPQYGELKKLRGIGPVGISDTSLTMDELLYGSGPNAVWRGNRGHE